MYCESESRHGLFRFADYHLHTARCGHASGSMEEYVRQAVDSGVSDVGFSDHLPLGPDRRHGHTMAMFEMDSYLEEIADLRQRYPRVRILSGGEVGLYAGFEDDLQELCDRFPLDYIIGSVHYFADSFVFGDQDCHMSRQKRQHEIHACFDLYRRGVESSLIDVIGHLDAVRCLFPDDDEIISEGAATVLEAAAARGTILELNTSGLRKSAGAMFPSLPLLERACSAGVPVCLGSDAHTPDQVGSAFLTAVSLVSSAGFARQAVSKAGLLVSLPLT